MKNASQSFLLSRLGITFNDHEEFLTEFMEEFLGRGFGTLSKRDTEVLLFHLFQKYGHLKEKTHHEISLLLRLTETRVKNLRYEVSLRYQEDEERQREETFRGHFLNLLKNTRFESRKRDVCFLVEDTFVQKEIQSRLKTAGYLYDSSFASEILRLSPEAFTFLVESLYTRKELQEISKGVGEALRERVTFRSLFARFLEGLCQEAGKTAVDLINMGFTGGASEIPKVVESVAGVLNSVSLR